MNTTRRVVLVSVLIAILACWTVFAAIGFKVKTPIALKDNIYVNESAEFNITIQNTKGVADSFRLSVPDSITWNLQTEPPSDKLSGINIDPYSPRTTHIIIYPSKDLKPSRYGVLLSIQSDYNSDVIQVPLEYNIKSGGIFVAPVLRPDLRIDVDMPNNGKFDPRKDTTITLYVKNQNQLTLQDVEVTLKNSFIEQAEKIEQLAPLERVAKSFTIHFNPKETPKADPLVITVTSGNKSFVTIKDAEILGYEAPFIEDLRTSY